MKNTLFLLGGIIVGILICFGYTQTKKDIYTPQSQNNFAPLNRETSLVKDQVQKMGEQVVLKSNDTQNPNQKVYTHPNGFYSLAYPNDLEFNSYPDLENNTTNMRIDIVKRKSTKMKDGRYTDTDSVDMSFQMFGPNSSPYGGSSCSSVDLTQRIQKNILLNDIVFIPVDNAQHGSYCVLIKTNSGNYSIVANFNLQEMTQFDILKSITTSIKFNDLNLKN